MPVAKSPASSQSASPTGADKPGLDQFWDAYARGLIVRMFRDRVEGYSGDLLDHQKQRVVRFVYSIAEVGNWEFTDPRFGLGVHHRLSDALAAVIGARLMNQDTIPHRRQLKLVQSLLGEELAAGDYPDVRSRVLAELQCKPIATGSAVKVMSQILPGPEQAAEVLRTGNLAPVRTDRQVLLKAFALTFSSPQISQAIRQVVDNHRHEDSVTVGLAIWALGRHNRKTDLAYLLGLLREPALRRHTVTIERALQFICSGAALCPMAENPLKSAEYWEGVLRLLPTADQHEKWADLDAASVFWDKRLRCAAQWAATNNHAELLEPLRTDEVPTIRRAAAPDGFGPGLATMSDTELLAAVFRGNDAALTLFCKRSLPALRREIDVSCRRAKLAPQVTDELFSEALERLITRVRTRSADAAPVANAIAWTKAIGRSVVLDHLSKLRKAPPPDVSLDQNPEATPGVSPGRPTAEDYDFMEVYFARLPPRQSEVMRLMFAEQLSVPDTAERLGITSDAVRKALSRALEVLRDLGFDRY